MTRMHERQLTTRSLALGVLAALLFAGCGGDDTNSASTTAVEQESDPTSETQPEATAATDDESVATEPATTEQASTEPATTTEPEADPGGDGIRTVPDEYPTIQAAVDAAVEGDLVLISPGVYAEAVDVVTDNLTIRGLDRDGVVLDGGLELDNGIRVLGASGVAVENLTTQNYTANGLFWIQATGYRASYVTTYRTGDYGIYAFDSVQGQIDNSHTIGSRDAGVYIGQCYPCDALVTNVVSSHNGLGYSGTNAGGNLLIVNSDWHNNRIGIVPNSGSYELCYPQRETTIIGNRVWDNNQADTSTIDFGVLAQRNGILIAGGIDNIVERNRVDGHLRFGIGLILFPEDTPNDDLPTEDEWALTCAESRDLPVTMQGASIQWESYRNVVRDNVVTGSGEADLVVASVGTDLSTLGNCFAGNEFETSAPTAIETLAPCDGEGSGDWTQGDYNIARWLAEEAELPPEVPWQEAPLPELGPHENMTDPATAQARPATDVPMTIDLDAITTPDLPTG